MAEIVQVLPYHRMGAAKYARLQRCDPMTPTEPPGSEEIAGHVGRLERLGLRAVVH